MVFLIIFAIVLTMNNITRFKLAIHGLEVFVKREGHCRVPAVFVEIIDGQEIPLGAWVGYMRQRYKTGQLSPERIARLELIPDWQWGPLPPGAATDVSRNMKIVELYGDGKSLRAIADTFELSRQRVHQIVNNKG